VRYQRELDTAASPRFRRAFLKLLAIGALVGLGIGILWVIAGILRFQVFG
jgi:hypothetical protein